MCVSCQVIIKINWGIQREKYKKAAKHPFTNEFFVNKKVFLPSVKHINLTPNIIETLSKYVLYTWEAYIHFGGTFLKPALQIFFKTFEDGHFGQKTSFFPEKIFEPPNFLAENIPTATKLCPDIRSILNLCQKNLCDHLITIDEKIWKKDPPYGSSPGGGCFWNHQFIMFFTWHDTHTHTHISNMKIWNLACLFFTGFF